MSIRIILLVVVTALLVAIEGIGTSIGNRHVEMEMEALSRQQLGLSAEVLRDALVAMMRNGVEDDELHDLYRRFRQMESVRDLKVWIAPSVVRDHQLEQHDLINSQPELAGLRADPSRFEWQLQADPPSVRFLDAVAAEPYCLGCHVSAQEGDILGVIDLRIDMSQVQRSVQHNQRELRVIALIELGVILLLLLVSGEWLVFRHLARLRRGVEQVANNGEHFHPIAGVSGNEIGVVIDGFNHMAQRIRGLMQEQRHTIETQTQELSILLETSQALSDAVDPLHSLDQLAENLTRASEMAACQILLWQAGGMGERLVRRSCFPMRDIPGIGDSTWGEVVLADCPAIKRVVVDKLPLVIGVGEVEHPCDRQLVLLGDGDSALVLPLLSRDEVLGAVILTEFRGAERAPVTPRKIELCKAMVFQTGVALGDARLHDRLLEQFNESAMALAEAVDKKSPWTAGHSRRVTQFALRLGRALGWDDERLERLQIAGLLHDIGKIGTPGAILNKSGTLTDEEFSVLRRHPADGGQILGRMTPFKLIVPTVRHHHERFDGRGYPDGLQGEAIPIEARVMAVADAFDAMIADRPYRKALPWEEALRRLDEGAGSQFDPEVVAVALKALSPNDGAGWAVTMLGGGVSP